MCKNDWWKDKALAVALENLTGFVKKSYGQKKTGKPAGAQTNPLPSKIESVENSRAPRSL